LIQAKAAGLIPEIRIIIDLLQRDAGFFMSPTLRNRVLQLVGE
jgi:predicted nucleic acid-binding protein